MQTATINEAIAAMASGGMIILADDEQRENEGDFVMVAQLVTAAAITFMAEQARTIITLALTAERCERLNLPLMHRDDSHKQDTAFTVTIEAAADVSTGSSATDRLRTIRAAVAADAKPTDLVRPGHVFPLRVTPGGVLNRAGHTEAASDLARLAGFEPAALISEIQLADGNMARLPDLHKIAQEYGLPFTTIAALIEFRCRNESLIECVSVAQMVTAYGEFTCHSYRDTIDGGLHMALVKGKLGKAEIPAVRVLANPSYLDAVAMASPQSSWTAPAALRYIREQPCGVLLSIDVDNPRKTKQDIDGNYMAASSAQVRNYGIGAQILHDLGVTDMRLLSSPLRLPSMAGFGLNVLEIIYPTD